MNDTQKSEGASVPPLGAGKSWPACAVAQYACRRGHSAYYQRVPRPGEELRIRHGSGTFAMSSGS